MADQVLTLKQLAAPSFNPNLLCIPDSEAECEFRPGLIRALPTFSGFRNTSSLGSTFMTDPNKFLKEFHIACSGMKPAGFTLDQLKLKAFPFALTAAAKEWLFDLPAGSITNWAQMQQIFLEKYFPASLAASIRKEICGITQESTETLHEYWERFKKLCNSCPNPQISEQLLMQYFYEGLTYEDRNLINAASGGALTDKTPLEARKLIANMATNSQYSGGRGINSTSTHHAKDGGNSKLEQQVAKLTALVEKMMTHNTYGHQVHAVGNFHGQQQGGFHAPHGFPSSQPQCLSQYQPNSLNYQPPYQQQPPPSGGMSLEEIVKTMATNTLQFQQETRSWLRNLETQVSQLTDTVGKLQARSTTSKWPSQPGRNPIENVSSIAVVMRKQMESGQSDMEKQNRSISEELTTQEKKDDKPSMVSNNLVSLDHNYDCFPCPSQLCNDREQEKEHGILDALPQKDIGTPISEEIEKAPCFTEDQKKLCTHTPSLKGDEKVSSRENLSPILEETLMLRSCGM